MDTANVAMEVTRSGEVGGGLGEECGEGFGVDRDASVDDKFSVLATPMGSKGEARRAIAGNLVGDCGLAVGHADDLEVGDFRVILGEE